MSSVDKRRLRSAQLCIAVLRSSAAPDRITLIGNGKETQRKMRMATAGLSSAGNGNVRLWKSTEQQRSELQWQRNVKISTVKQRHRVA